MGTRTVTTVFAVSGEKDYRQAVQNINRDIKLLDSALKLNAEKWKGQEDAMVALKEKSTILNDLYKKQEEKVGAIETAWKNCKDAAEKYKGQIDKIEQAIKDTKDAMDKLSGEGKTDSDAFTNLGKKLESLEKELDNKKGMYDAAIRGAQNWETALNNASTELLEIENKLNPALDALANKVAPAFDNVTDSIQDVGDEADEMERKVPASVSSVAKLVTAAGLAKAFELIRDTMQECIDKSVQFETDVVGVFKTVDLSADEEEAMADAIKDLSTRIPATTTEIAGVAEAAGQLGIAKEDILAFSEVMLKLGTTTNIGSTAAAESLAKLANITELDVKDYERLGSAIVDLGNNGSSSEEQIVEMATRMAATGDIVGMTVQDMLAYATALSDVGIEAEAGGTAISKMFKKIQLAVETNRLDDTMYDEISGMSPEEFTKLWGDDPARALLAFINGLQKADEEGESAVAILDEMGLTADRLSNGMLALTAAGELLEEHLDRAYKAWDENTALEAEAARRYETTASKITILKNSLDELKIAAGDKFVEWMKPAIEVTTDLAQKITDVIETSSGVSGAVQDVLDANDAILKRTENSKTIYEQNMAAAELNKEKVQSLIEKLWAFYDEAEKTPATEAIIKNSVDRLNELLPGLGAKYDEVTGKINLTRTAMEKFAEAAANQQMLDALEGYLDETLGNQAQLKIQEKETDYLLKAAKERYEKALKEVEKLGPVPSGYTAQAKYYNSAAYQELTEAGRELRALTEDAAEIEAQLREAEHELELRNDVYDGIVAEMAESARKVEQMVTYAEAADTAVKNMQHHSLARFGDTSAAEQQLYRAMVDTVGGNGVMGGLTGVGNNLPAANITIVNELDGREIGREVARVQYGDAQITARTKGVR